MTSRLITILLFCSYSALSQTFEELYRSAQLHTQKGEYNNALRDLELIQTTDVQDQLDVLRFRILLLHQLGRTSEAQQACNDYLSLADDPEIRITLGEILMSINEPYRALEQFQDVVDAYPELPIGHIMHGLIMAQLGKTEAAKRDLAVAEKGNVDGYSDIELVQMSTAFNMAFEYEKALTYAEGSITKKPGAQAYAMKGWALNSLKRYTAAIDPLTTSISLKPSYLAYMQRGKSNYMLKNDSDAEADFRMSLRLQADLDEAYLYLGYIYQSRNMINIACELWEKAVNINKDSDAAGERETHCK